MRVRRHDTGDNAAKRYVPRLLLHLMENVPPPPILARRRNLSHLHVQMRASLLFQQIPRSSSQPTRPSSLPKTHLPQRKAGLQTVNSIRSHTVATLTAPKCARHTRSNYSYRPPTLSSYHRMLMLEVVSAPAAPKTFVRPLPLTHAGRTHALLLILSLCRNAM